MGHGKVALIQRPSVRWWQSQNQNLGVPVTQQGFIPLHSFSSVQFSYSVMSDSLNPWIVAHQASLSTTNSWSLLKLMSIDSVMPSKYLILCCPLLLLPSIFPSIRVFSSESVLHIRWPKYRSFSFNISPSNEHSRLVSFRIGLVGFIPYRGGNTGGEVRTCSSTILGCGLQAPLAASCWVIGAQILNPGAMVSIVSPIPKSARWSFKPQCACIWR